MLLKNKNLLFLNNFFPQIQPVFSHIWIIFSTLRLGFCSQIPYGTLKIVIMFPDVLLCSFLFQQFGFQMASIKKSYWRSIKACKYCSKHKAPPFDANAKTFSLLLWQVSGKLFSVSSATPGSHWRLFIFQNGNWFNLAKFWFDKKRAKTTWRP